MAELATLYKQYKAAKLTADQAAKEEDKLKKALKKAELKATQMRTVSSLKELFRTERAWMKRVCWRASKRKGLLSVSRRLRQ